jgi:predicted nuclease of restriction endonuclease-like (RecB) superfamily
MRAFAEASPEEPIVQAVLAQITWYHNVILEKLTTFDDSIWYAKATIQHGWSRNVLELQIEAGRHRQGRAVANFDRTLHSPQSDLARDITKDPYNFDFLALGDDAKERDLGSGLIDHLRQFLLELGVGFAFVRSQYRLTIGNEDFFIDLLFYHLKLRAFVVVDLKMNALEPEFAGKMNFYLSAVNDLLRRPDDQPSIGIILCKTRDHFVAEYALRDTNKPIGISEYRLAAVYKGMVRAQVLSINTRS